MEAVRGAPLQILLNKPQRGCGDRGRSSRRRSRCPVEPGGFDWVRFWEQAGWEAPGPWRKGTPDPGSTGAVLTTPYPGRALDFVKMQWFPARPRPLVEREARTMQKESQEEKLPELFSASFSRGFLAELGARSTSPGPGEPGAPPATTSVAVLAFIGFFVGFFLSGASVWFAYRSHLCSLWEIAKVCAIRVSRLQSQILQR
uniref:Uncharacterized protein n=1 Tax=Sphaerodactylus townsendi TaxID=933632 RepID=A0ACB8E6T5_9SAUR